MKSMLFGLTILTLVTASGQSGLSDLESFVVPTDSALCGAEQVTDGDTIYVDGDLNYETNWNAGWWSYAGFAISNVTDNTTPGYGNQFSAIPGSGADASTNYAVCYASPFNNHRVFGFDGAVITSVDITNTTYAYFSMLNGDSFAKKFGEDTSATGTIDGTNGEDWFLLTIYALGPDSLYTGDSVNFYLADFTFAADSLDYIIDTWTDVSLISLGPVSGLDFLLTSSDTSGGFGMNTPAYVALDNLEFIWVGIDENESSLAVFPNPASNEITIRVEVNSTIEIHDLSGRNLMNWAVEAGVAKLDISHLTSGSYIISVNYGVHRNITHFVKI